MRLRPSIFGIIGAAALWLAVAHVAQAATLFVSPSSASTTVGGSVTVSVIVNAGGTAINAAQATLSFPTDTLETTTVSKGGLFTLWPVDPSTSGGSISFAGGLPSPGYSGSAGTVVIVTFRAKAVGTTTISLGGASVLANDGLGTNVLTGTGGATITISAAVVTPTPTPTIEEPSEPASTALPAPVIYSDTHPDPETWYADGDASFVWDKLDGALEFSYAFDDQEDTTPDDIANGSDNTAIYDATGDGVWYFHVKVRNDAGWSETAHFRVRIDTTSPTITEARFEGDSPTKNRQPKLHVSAVDTLSGVAQITIRIDDETFLTITPDATHPLMLPELGFGRHTILVSATDAAGNVSSEQLTIEIIRYDPESGFWFGSTFILYIWVIWGLLALIQVLVVVLMLFILCCRRCRDKRSQPKKRQEKTSAKR